MTCIVGVEHDGRVWIGADAAGVAGYSITARADLKCWSSGPWAFGFTSSFRMGQILRYGFTPPAVATWDIDRYMAIEFVNALRTSLDEHGWKRTESGRDEGGVFLAAYRDRLYRVDADFQIGRSHDGYAAVGAGDGLALGSLFATVGTDPEQRVLSALRAAAHHSAAVCAPFEIVATEAAQ